MVRKAHRFQVQQRHARRLEIMKADCPECGAKSGAKCIGKSGLRTAPHRARATAPRPQAVVSMYAGPSTDDKLSNIIDDGKRWAAEAVEESYAWGAKRCESPIEKLLLAQFIHPGLGNDWDARCHVMMPPSPLIEHVQPPPIAGFYLWPQIQIGPHRVDFIFAGVLGDLQPSYSIIECDGHDFHERTKEQAQRDKARDRYLIGKGYRILRFTGSEIYRDPEAVWEEIIKITLGLCD